MLDFGRVIAAGTAGRGPRRPRRARRLPRRRGRAVRTEVLRRSRARPPATARSRALDDVSFTAERGRDHRRPRRQRRRQDHAAAHDLRPGRGPSRAASTLDGRDITRTPAEAMPGLGHGARARGPRRDHRAHRRGEPPPRRAGPRRARCGPSDLDRVYDLFPALAERRTAPRAHALRRRAADARDRPGADGRAAAAAARRALARASRRGSSRRSSRCCATSSPTRA